jgi:hypothetical protein
MMSIKTSTILLYIQFSAMAGSFAFATPSRYQLARRAAPDNTVIVKSATEYWFDFNFRLKTYYEQPFFFSLIVPRFEFLRNSKIPSRRSIIFFCSDFFWIRDAHTNIGDSEQPGGTTSYCSADAKYSDEQGELASKFWSDVAFISGEMSGRYAQRMFFSFPLYYL